MKQSLGSVHMAVPPPAAMAMMQASVAGNVAQIPFSSFSIQPLDSLGVTPKSPSYYPSLHDNTSFQPCLSLLP